MKAYFVVVGKYSGWPAVKALAFKNAGCEIIVLHTIPDRYQEWKKKADSINGGNVTLSCAQARWFSMAEDVETRKPAGPVAIIDWDECVFRNLEQTWSAYTGFDAGSTCDEEWGKSAMMWPHVLSGYEWIIRYRDALEEWAENGVAPKTDLHGWDLFYSQAMMTVADLQSKPDCGVWDHHLMCGNYRWKRDETTHRDEHGEHRGKLIEWSEGKPHFVTHEGTLEPATTLHCWGKFKGMEHEFLKRSLA